MLRAPELTKPLRDEFIRLIYDGYRPNDAAKELDSTGSQFRRLRNPKSASYDAEHAEEFEKAIKSPEHAQNFLEKLREAVWQRAEAGDARLLEKLSLIYDPDWEPLKSTNFNMNVNVLARVLPYLSNDELERAIEAAKQAEIEGRPLKLLPAAEQ